MILLLYLVCEHVGVNMEDEHTACDSELVVKADTINCGTDAKDTPFPVYLTKQNSRRCISNRSYSRRTDRNSKRIVRRLIKKNGTSAIIRQKLLPSFWHGYIRDLSNTLVNSRWKWCVISLSASFLVSWGIFALIWLLISSSNGDLDPEKPSTTPCLSGIKGFGGYIMFSIETQQTIGYGSRYINHYCPEGTFLMCFQIILGCALCGAMVSIVNAKMAHPLQIYSRNLFSKHAVIGIRDGHLCLIFRVRDEQSRYSIGTTINAYLVQSRPAEPFLKSLHIEQYGILIWPLEIIHKITSSSPFWDLSAKELVTKRFEIIATMTGTSSVTGQCSTTRTSYLSTEILWGCRFKPCVHFDGKQSSYVVNHSDFNSTQEVLTPLCSAQRLQEVIEEIVTPNENTTPDIFTFDDLHSDYSDEESNYDNLDDDEHEVKNEFVLDAINLNKNKHEDDVVDLELLIKSIENDVKQLCKETDL